MARKGFSDGDREVKPAAKDAVSTALDVVGLFAVATGVVAGSYPYIGGWAIAVGGALVMGVSMWWGRNRDGDA